MAYLVAYNLMRWIMADAAREHSVALDRVSLLILIRIWFLGSEEEEDSFFLRW